MGGLALFHLAGVQIRSEPKQGLPSGSTHPLPGRQNHSSHPAALLRCPGPLPPSLAEFVSVFTEWGRSEGNAPRVAQWDTHAPFVGITFCVQRSRSHQLVWLTYHIALLNPIGLTASPNFSVFLHKPCCLHRPFPPQLSFPWAWVVLGTLGPMAASQGKTGIIIHGTSRQRESQ